MGKQVRMGDVHVMIYIHHKQVALVAALEADCDVGRLGVVDTFWVSQRRFDLCMFDLCC